jgi:hypothetical protein
MADDFFFLFFVWMGMNWAMGTFSIMGTRPTRTFLALVLFGDSDNALFHF